MQVGQRPSTNHKPPDPAWTRRHLGLLARADGYYEIRTLRRQPDDDMLPGPSTWLAIRDGKPANLDAVISWAGQQHAKGLEVFVGYNPRSSRDGKKKEDVTTLTACYLDLDLKGEQLREATAALLAAPIPPGLIIMSGYGLHAIWWLITTTDKDGWQLAQKGLARAFEAWHPDPAIVTDESRVLRLLPYPNGKGGKRVSTALVHQAQDAPAHTLAALHTAYPLPVPPPVPAPSPTRSDRPAVPPGLVKFALAGQGDGQRNKACFWLACRLVEEVADEAEGRAVLELFGRRCSPPLTPEVIAKTWKSAHATTSYNPKGDIPPPAMAAPPPANPAPAEEPEPEADAKPDLLTAGQLWAELYAQDWGYDMATRSWRRWTGTHWEDLGAKHAALDRQAAAMLRMLGLKIDSPGRLDGTIRCAIPFCLRPFPLQSGMVNFANGTLDIATGTLRAFERADGLTYCLNYAYSTASHPQIDAFLAATIPDADARQAVLMHLGLALLGDTRLHNMILLIGPRRSGKSTLLQLGNAVCGNDPSSNAGPELFDRASEGLRSRAAWNGRRLVTIEELPVEALRNEELVKAMTSHGGVAARRLHAPEELKNQWTPKLMMATNEAPRYTDHSGALTDRLVPVRCPNSRSDQPDTQDPFLFDSLIGELGGFAATCIAAGQALLELRTTRYPLSASMRSDLQGIEQSGDALKSFLGEECVLDRDAWVPSSVLYKAYQHYCEENGNRAVSQKKLAGVLVERYHCTAEARHWEGKKPRGLAGIRLRNGGDDPPDGTDGTDGTDRSIWLSVIHPETSVDQIKQSVPSVPSVPEPPDPPAPPAPVEWGVPPAGAPPKPTQPCKKCNQRDYRWVRNGGGWCCAVCWGQARAPV